MPGARCTRGLVCKIVRRSAHEHTGSAEAIRHSLRNGFTAYAVLSPATNSSCHRRHADWWLGRARLGPTNLRGLGASNGCQDHTVLPYAKTTPFVLRAVVHSRARPALRTACRARRCRVHRIPSRVRDDRDPPLFRDGMARADSGDLPDGESGIFFARGTGPPKSAWNRCVNRSLRATDFRSRQD